MCWSGQVKCSGLSKAKCSAVNSTTCLLTDPAHETYSRTLGLVEADLHAAAVALTGDIALTCDRSYVTAGQWRLQTSLLQTSLLQTTLLQSLERQPYSRLTCTPLL